MGNHLYEKSIGKMQGLETIIGKDGIVRAIAMDQRGSLRNAFAKAKNVAEKDIPDKMMREFKECVSSVLTPKGSAVLLDPEYGLNAAKLRANGKGLLLAIEQSGYEQTTPGRIPLLLEDWDVKKLKGAGANAVKFLMYYSPDDEGVVKDVRSINNFILHYNPKDKRRIRGGDAVNATKHLIVEILGEQCRKEDIPFLLEFVGYLPDVSKGEEKSPENVFQFAREKPEIVRKSIAEFSKPQYGVDVLKVEIPVNMQFVEGAPSFKGVKAYTLDEAEEHFKNCASVAEKPFIFLSAGVNISEFVESLELANKSGVPYCGVLCGRASWQDGISSYVSYGREEFVQWLSSTGVRNVGRVNDVLTKGAKSMRRYYSLKEKLMAGK